MFKLIRKLLLFTPILIGMVFVSYRVDPSGLFWGAGFERMASEYMLQGIYIDGYERLDGRALNEVYAKNVEEAPQILVNGSSRSMMIDTSFTTGEKTFYNASNVGADIYDFFTSYYIFSKEGKEPEIFVMGLDAWLFNDYEESYDKRSNKELYYEFIGEELGFENTSYEAPNPLDKYTALLDPSYFQGSIKYYFKDKSTEVQPEPVPRELIYEQEEVIKAPDGSVIYDKNFRTRPQEQADHDALTTANTETIMRLYGFEEISPVYKEQFEAFIEYLQAKNIQIIFFLPPYHPIVYSKITERNDLYHCVPELEQYLRDTAAKYGITVCGSYDPAVCGLANTDFLDGIHLRQESIKKIMPVLG